jgi:hypothetical protein
MLFVSSYSPAYNLLAKFIPKLWPTTHIDHMSAPQEPKPAKLVIGLFMKDRTLFEPLATELISEFGSLDMVSPWLVFDYTTYYEQEMGSPLFRRFLAFKSLIEQSELSTVKLTTNRLEAQYSRNGRRRVNIDPGYLLYERFVLASGKNFSHRIYIGHRIYADLTLIYKKGAFENLPWTYPDYADRPILGFLEQVRNKYAVDVMHAA